MIINFLFDCQYFYCGLKVLHITCDGKIIKLKCLDIILSFFFLMNTILILRDLFQRQVPPIMFKLLIVQSPVEIWDLSTFGILTLCMISNHTLEVCIWEFGCHSVWILLRWTSCRFYIEGEVEDSDHLTNVNFAATAKPAHRNKPTNENISLLKVI